MPRATSFLDGPPFEAVISLTEQATTRPMLEARHWAQPWRVTALVDVIAIRVCAASAEEDGVFVAPDDLEVGHATAIEDVDHEGSTCDRQLGPDATLMDKRYRNPRHFPDQEGPSSERKSEKSDLDKFGDRDDASGLFRPLPALSHCATGCHRL